MLQRNDTRDALDIAWPSKFNEVPKEVFHREDVYRLELERIFYGAEWHMLAHRSELSKPGDYKTVLIGQSPILVVHGDDGVIRVFANSCTHRGTQLRTCARGNGKEIECPYHRWVFNNQGELMGAPGMREFQKSFRREDYRLKTLRSAEFCGIIFATFSDETPELDDYLGETKPFIAKAVGGDGRSPPGGDGGRAAGLTQPAAPFSCGRERCGGLASTPPASKQLQPGLGDELDAGAMRLLHPMRDVGVRLAQLTPFAEQHWLQQPVIRDIWHDHVLFSGDDVTGIVDFGAVTSIRRSPTSRDWSAAWSVTIDEARTLRARCLCGVATAHRATIGDWSICSTRRDGRVRPSLGSSGSTSIAATWDRWAYRSPAGQDPTAVRAAGGAVSSPQLSFTRSAADSLSFFSRLSIALFSLATILVLSSASLSSSSFRTVRLGGGQWTVQVADPPQLERQNLDLCRRHFRLQINIRRQLRRIELRGNRGLGGQPHAGIRLRGDVVRSARPFSTGLAGRSLSDWRPR